MNLGPEYVEVAYRHVNRDLLAAIKSAAAGLKGTRVTRVPEPGSREYSMVRVRATAHSWYASRQLYAEFFARLNDVDQKLLALLRESKV